MEERAIELGGTAVCPACGATGSAERNFCGACGKKQVAVCRPCWVKHGPYNCGLETCPGLGLYVIEVRKSKV